MNFKRFLNEQQTDLLTNKVSNIINGVSQLQSDMPQMGSRNIIRNATQIADEIRKILNSNWDNSDNNILISLQQCAFAILSAIDNKTDLSDTINDVLATLQSLTGDAKMPINNLGNEEPENTETDDSNQDFSQKTA